MKRREIMELKEKMDQIDSNSKIKKLDKMSLHFVLPLVLFYALIGLLLILLNELVTDVAAWALAGGMVLFGGWFLLRYFRADVQNRLAGADMAMGLVLLLAGILLMRGVTDPVPGFADMREVFPKIWGLSLIFGGFLKIQYAFDERSVKVQKWWLMLIFAAVSLAIGILALLNKAVFGDNQHLVIGIFMLAEAVLDLVTYFILSRGMKKHTAPSASFSSVPAPAEQETYSAPQAEE